jgi:PAS domain S-box-containing protein
MALLDVLRELINRTADGAYIVDQDQRIIAWNAAAEELLGFRGQDVMGFPCYQIVGGQGDEGCTICRRGCFPHTAGRRGELVPSFDVRVRTTSGHPRWVNANVMAITLEDEQANGAVAVIHFMRDMESKKQAEGFANEVATWARQLKLQPATPEPRMVEAPLTTPLSRREYQVLQLLAEGADTGTIAAKLVMSKSTARNHIQHVLHKLGVHNRLEAVTYARTHHLLD